MDSKKSNYKIYDLGLDDDQPDIFSNPKSNSKPSKDTKNNLDANHLLGFYQEEKATSNV